MPFNNPKAREAFFASQKNSGIGMPFQKNTAPAAPTFSPAMKAAITTKPAFQLGSNPKTPRFTQLTSMFKNKGM